MWLIDMQRFHSVLSWATFIQEQGEKCGFPLLRATLTNGEGLRPCLGAFLGGIYPYTREPHLLVAVTSKARNSQLFPAVLYDAANWLRVPNSQSI